MRTNKLFRVSFGFVVGALFVMGARVGHANPLTNFFDDYRLARENGKTTHSLGIDNDTLLLNRNDGFYTSGLRYTQTSTLQQDGQASVYGWHIGQELYTPSDIKLPPALISARDHPYAGWLSGGFFKEVHKDDGTHYRLGVDLGCLGPCAGGRWTQTNFHRLIDQPLPQGWSRQVKNEIGVVLHGEIAPVRWHAGDAFDLTPSLRGRFGNIFTDVGAGLTARAGRLNVLPNQSAFYGFLRANVNLVAYNATLQGGYFSDNNPHTVDPKRVVGEAEIGLAWAGGPYGARIGLVRRGNEIKDLPNSVGAQNYVRMEFSYTP